MTIAARRGRGDEAREVVIGIIEERLWTAVITWRSENVRLISVRRSRDDEKELYDGQDD